MGAAAHLARLDRREQAMSTWASCAPEPREPLCGQRHVDPKADTIPDPADHSITSVTFESFDMTTRPATEADMRHCASCTCPVEQRLRPGKGDAQ
jgi:hypothetical protein